MSGPMMPEPGEASPEYRRGYADGYAQATETLAPRLDPVTHPMPSEERRRREVIEMLAEADAQDVGADGIADAFLDMADRWAALPPDTREEGLPSDKEVARLFHEAYERLAPRFGYRTRHESAKPWTDVPATNKALMAATVHEVRAALASTPRPGLDVITGTRNDVSPDG